MQLPEQLAAGRPENIFLLLDGGQFPDLGKKISALKDGLPQRALYSGPRLREAMEVSPRLVAFAEDSRLLAEYLEQGREGFWGLLLESETGLDETAAHLAWLCIAHEPDGQDVAFRYFDPRIFPAVLGAAPNEEWGVFLGPVKRAWIPAADEESWLMIEKPLEAVTVPDYAATYALSREQMRAMSDASRSFFLAGLGETLNESYPALLAGRPPQDAAAFYLKQANACGFTRHDDVYGFCQLCGLMLEHGESPWDSASPEIASLMKESPDLTPETRLERAMACYKKVE